MTTRVDLTGKRFGGLTVSGFHGVTGGRSRHYKWSCLCDCGATHVVDASHLKTGHVRSCGCKRNELFSLAKSTHGATRGDKPTVEYTTWQSMIARCSNPKSKGFARYGGAGVTVCDRWATSFAAFIADMGPRPTGHSIDRIDNAKGYEPSNCRWATTTEQVRNRALTFMVDWVGRTLPLAAACEEAELPYHSVWQRINRLGWTVSRSLSEPLRVRA